MKCKRCGWCCRMKGFVYFTQFDMKRLDGKYPEIADCATFDKVCKSHKVRNDRNGYCTFLDHDGKSCLIYLARPAQCRDHPDFKLKADREFYTKCQMGGLHNGRKS